MSCEARNKFGNFYEAHKVKVANAAKASRMRIFEMFIKPMAETKRENKVKHRCETSDGIL